MPRKANAVFVMVAADAPTRMLGYFTLCALALEPGECPRQRAGISLAIPW